jgi:hypothetical protein
MLIYRHSTCTLRRFAFVVAAHTKANDGEMRHVTNITIAKNEQPSHRQSTGIQLLIELPMISCPYKLDDIKLVPDLTAAEK